MRYQYSPKGEMPLYDLFLEPQHIQSERLWIEAQIREARKANLRLGVFEHLEVTIARVQDAHQRERIEATESRKKRERERLWMTYLKCVLSLHYLPASMLIGRWPNLESHRLKGTSDSKNCWLMICTLSV